MFVLTVDQVASRRQADRVDSAIGELASRFGPTFPLDPERTAGDEFQVITPDPASALGAVLLLGRRGGWSIGLGLGAVDSPLESSIRATSGAAFIAARAAVEAARRLPEPRFALRGPDDAAADDLEALIGLVLLVRGRRTEAGWALADLLEQGLTRTDAAQRLGISAQAASQRAIAAGLRVEQRAVPALTRLLGAADAAVSSGAADAAVSSGAAKTAVSEGPARMRS